MSDQELFFALLRVSAAQALRAAGLTTAKPSVLDAVTDILSRYLTLLGSTTRDIAESSGRTHAELPDVRLALEHVGLLRPLNIFSDRDDEDTRAVDAFVEWMKGAQAAEMRRVAGFGVAGEENVVLAAGAGAVTGATTMPAVAVGGATLESGARGEEWVAAIRKVTDKRRAVGTQ
ncbi:uncharacterized protein H6S33_002112 [Morchella sextelata]|uniref:uncharacterized protein n=1 Tax=Morchella sextelata TaxID=1174677 RepID=UPI001D036403|nr:uncharacterized protein H6S33_002112 [Morchella sextelata]KAH0608060.1 hypothetical protein H6S33_002112 [Morchella sextelata]